MRVLSARQNEQELEHIRPKPVIRIDDDVIDDIDIEPIS